MCPIPPFWSPLPFHEAQRVSLSLLNATGSMAANLIIPLFFWSTLVAFGGGDYKSGFPKLMVIFGVVAIVILLYHFFFTRERYTPVSTEKIRFVSGVKQVLKNKYLLIVLGVSFAVNLAQFFFTSVIAYYGKLVLNDLNFPTTVVLVFSVVSILSFPVLNVLAKKVSVKKVYITAQVIALLCNVVRFLLGINNPTIMLITVAITGIQGAANFLPAVMLADTYEYGEWKFNHRVVGTATALNGFFYKVAMSFASAISLWMLSWANYTEDAVLTDKIYQVLQLNMIHIPFFILLISLIVFIKFYNLDELMPQIRQDLALRRASAQQTSPEDSQQTI